jgi:UDP-2,3-diacylglucosamine pyrophosphatase LpxH
MSKNKRNLDLVVLSDIHLGTYGCHAHELLNYLKSIQPKKLVLNGDIIDAWQFKKRYFPKSHMKVVKQIISMATKKTKVYYITGNHDEIFRKFTDIKLGKITVCNDLKLDIDGKKAWFFHGDVFDVVMQYSKWLARLGAMGYDLLIYLNAFVNYISSMLGKGKVSLSKRIKENVKSAVKYINNFEETAAEVAIERQFDYIVCGHIHHADKKSFTTKKGSICYLNSGDWIENLTALEYHKGNWNVFRYNDQFLPFNNEKSLLPAEAKPLKPDLEDYTNKELFQIMLNQMAN